MKDILLKLTMRKILWVQGYHCPLEVDLSHFEYEATGQFLKRSPITDIDVLGIRFDSDLRCRSIVVDCKAGKESEPNRIFWLKGVMDFFGAQEGVFIKTVLHAQARFLAPKLGIRVLDEKGLEILAKSLDLDKVEVSVGELSIHQKVLPLWGIDVKPKQSPTAQQLRLKAVYHYLKYLYWMVDGHRNIQTLIDKFSQIKDTLSPSDPKAKYLVHIALQRLTLSILKMSSEIAGRDLSDVTRQSRAYLFGGSIELREREQIVTLLNKLGKENNLIFEKISLEPPYFDELIEIVNKVIQNSFHACHILHHLDEILLGLVFGKKQKLEIALGNMYSIDALVIAKRIGKLFCQYTGIDERLFEELWIL